jgi:hypothetical protein
MSMSKIGIAGTVNGFGVLVLGDLVIVNRDGAEISRRTVDGIGTFATTARDLRLGWGAFPDDMQAIYLYDRGDDAFGYALNLDWPDGSEWGYAPFVVDNDVCDLAHTA